MIDGVKEGGGKMEHGGVEEQEDKFGLAEIMAWLTMAIITIVLVLGFLKSIEILMGWIVRMFFKIP